MLTRDCRKIRSAQLHRQKEAELKAEVLAVVDDHPQKIAALRASLTAAKRQLDLRTLLHEGGRFKPVKEDSDLRELLNFALQDRYAARFRALSVEEQRDEIESLTARIDFNDPDPAIAAKLATIDLAQPQGLARSALIAAFTTLETKWKNRTELVSQIEQAEQDLSAAEGYAAAIERPELPLPTAAAMNEAAEHGHLKVA